MSPASALSVASIFVAALQCFDNPTLQSHELLQPHHAGCVIRCASDCSNRALLQLQNGSGEYEQMLRLSGCCASCRNDCVAGRGGKAGSELLFLQPGTSEARFAMVALLCGIVLVAGAFALRNSARVRQQINWLQPFLKKAKQKYVPTRRGTNHFD